MSIKWNIVNRTGELYAEVQQKLQNKIGKLEKHLEHFPQDAVYLQVILDARASDKTYEVALNLRVPSDVLHVEKESESLVAALDEGVNTLVRRLKRLKARYRRDHAWKRRGRDLPQRDVAFAETAVLEGEGPQTFEDTVVAVLEQDYERLLAFVARQLNEYILSGSIPRKAIEPRDIVDAVAEQALRHPEQKPRSMDYRTWCSSLAFRQTREAIRQWARETSVAIPVDLDVAPEPVVPGDDDLEPEEFALNLLQRQLEPDEATMADVTPDPNAEPPDTQLQRQDMFAALQQVVRGWPKLERETFQLHFLEGLSAEDLAHTFACERTDIEASISRLRARLRTVLSETAEIGAGEGPSAAQAAAYGKHLREVVADSPADRAAKAGA